MKSTQVLSGAAVLAMLLLALFMLGSAPAKRGGITAYVRFEIANPVTSFDTLDANPPAPDPERMLRTEAARMIDDMALDAAGIEIVSLGLQPPTIDELRAMVRAEVVPGTYFVDLTASATTESDALSIVTAFADGYRNRFIDHRDQLLLERIELLERSIRDCRLDAEQIDSRCSTVMAREKLTRLTSSADNSITMELRLVNEAITVRVMDRAAQRAHDATPEQRSEPDPVLDELEDRRQILCLRLESETNAMHYLHTLNQEREAKTRLISELQRDVGRLRHQRETRDTAYPAIRMLNKPRIRSPRVN